MNITFEILITAFDFSFRLMEFVSSLEEPDYTLSTVSYHNIMLEFVISKEQAASQAVVITVKY